MTDYCPDGLTNTEIMSIKNNSFSIVFFEVFQINEKQSLCFYLLDCVSAAQSESRGDATFSKHMEVQQENNCDPSTPLNRVLLEFQNTWQRISTMLVVHFFYPLILPQRVTPAFSIYTTLALNYLPHKSTCLNHQSHQFCRFEDSKFFYSNLSMIKKS